MSRLAENCLNRSELEQLVYDKLDECMKIAETKFARNFKMPSVMFDKRGTVAGTANSTTNTVNFNRVLLEENGADFVARTVPHELAHLIDHAVHNTHDRSRYGKRSVHGRTWKNIMRLFGAPESRCHSYDTENARTKTKNKFNYKCSCGAVLTLGPVRHRRHQERVARGGAGYSHSKSSCPVSGSSLVFEEALGQVTYKEAMAGKRAPAKRAKKSRACKAGSKMARAVEMFTSNPGIGRKMMIGMFMDDLNMSKAGATTYYYNVSKRAA